MTIDLDHLPQMMDAVARSLLGEPNQALSSAKEWRYGNRGSLSVDLEKGSWFDHETNEGGGVLDLVERETHLTGAERINWLGLHGFADIVEPNGGGHAAPRARIVSTYDYVDEAGTLLFQVVRFEPKDFRQRRPDGNGWAWSVKGVRQVPYRLPALLENHERVVCIVEGEKDVDRLWTLGIPATTNAGGAGKWKDELSAYFRGADVVVIPDRDPQKKHPKTGELMFHEDGRPILPGQDHAQQVAQSLSGIASRVRVLELWRSWPDMPPKADVSDWIAKGGTVDQLYALIERLPDWSPNEVEPTIKQPLFAYVARPFDQIPARQWLHARHYVRRYVVMTVAPGGYGKSSLLLCNAVEMATGIGLIGPNPIEPVKCVYWNAEEAEVEEIERRIAALCIAHKSKINADMLNGNLFLGPKISNDEWRFASVDRMGKVLINTVLVKQVTEFLGDNSIGCAMLDPLIAFHHIPENDTGAMETLIKSIIEPIAIKTNACNELRHHTRKPSMFGGEITADESRGAGAAVNAARSVRVLNRMSTAEAEQAKIIGDERKLYLRVTRDKANMSKPDKARWIRLVGREIGNAPAGKTGDTVQAVVAWSFPKAFDGVTAESMHFMRAKVATGNYRLSSKSPDWVGLPLIEHLGLDPDEAADRKKAAEILQTWIKSGALGVEERPDERRKPKAFVTAPPWRDHDDPQRELFDDEEPD
jgi:hypothetical protein